MKFILGTKQQMTQVFDEDGRVHPVTVLKTGPVTVTQVKTTAKDGYEAIQIGFGEKKAKNINKAQKGHMKDLGNFQYLKEVKGVNAPAVGEKIDATLAAGDKVTVTAISKSKGFQGVVKRHGFAGGPRSHGQKHSEREPGSIGAGGNQRVFKGRRMAGRMGGDQITVKNLIVVAYDKENGELFVRGAIPGRRGTLVEVRG
ncbi:MAG: Ribosomal protein large subunit ribosomal protein [Candidatus Parcubacteria bacterium]|jgi:large subunit ribosomal protein L3